MTESQNEQYIQTSNSTPIEKNKNDNISIYFSIIWIILLIIRTFSIRVWGPTLPWIIFLWPCFVIIWFILWIIRLFRKPRKKAIISIIVSLFSLFICFFIIAVWFWNFLFYWPN